MKSIIYCIFLIFLFAVKSFANNNRDYLPQQEDTSYVFIAAIFEGPIKLSEDATIPSGGPIFFKIKPEYSFKNNYSNPLQFFKENGCNTIFYLNETKYTQLTINCPSYQTPSPSIKKLHYCIAIYKIKKSDIIITNFSPKYKVCAKLESDLLFEDFEIMNCSTLEVVSFFYFDLSYDNFSWEEYDMYECLKRWIR